MKKGKTNLLLRTLALLLIFSVAACTLSSCKDKNNGERATKLSFKAASGYDYLKTLDGKDVTINGYMATSSPVDGSFMFLMNLPYQSCPFCIPNTSQLSNTMEIYPKKGQSFEYTTQAIKVVGTLAVAADPAQPFTDKYGYEFNYKIVDATYTVIGDDELSSNMALWQKIAKSDVITKVNEMYDYVNFLCAWNTYFVNTRTDANGKTVPGYYLYPSDAERLIYNDGAQYNYGYKEGYFDSIVTAIEAVDKEAFADLVANVRKAEALANKALAELQNKNYTSEFKYVKKFNNEDYVYTLKNGAMLQQEMNTVYAEFSNWLGSWEL
jgi:hypothetical protein